MTNDKIKILESRIASVEEKMAERFENIEQSIIYVGVTTDEIKDVIWDILHDRIPSPNARIYGWFDEYRKTTKVEPSPILDELDL